MRSEVRASSTTGWADGSTFRNDGGVVICFGSERWATEIADCTSSAAASIERSSSNCSTIWLEPSVEDEVIEVTPGIAESCCSSGVATEAAITSGLAPGSEAVTWMVGKSIAGRAATGSMR